MYGSLSTDYTLSLSLLLDGTSYLFLCENVDYILIDYVFLDDIGFETAIFGTNF